jgi:hypothetical protein
MTEIFRKHSVVVEGDVVKVLGVDVYAALLLALHRMIFTSVGEEVESFPVSALRCIQD